jgi:dipeptide/tripeptide permease
MSPPLPGLPIPPVRPRKWRFVEKALAPADRAASVRANRLLGRTRTMVIGAVLMSLGHFLMAFEPAFLLALLCLVLGVGCFKGNIASQVGGLYGQNDLRRAMAFQIFYIAINISALSARSSPARWARRSAGISASARPG